MSYFAMFLIGCASTIFTAAVALLIVVLSVELPEDQRTKIGPRTDVY